MSEHADTFEEVFLKHRQDFEAFLKHRVEFEAYLRHQPQIQTLLRSFKRSREEETDAVDCELQHAIRSLQKSEQMKEMRARTARVEAFLDSFMKANSSFFTDAEWENFNLFVTKVCTEHPAWIGHVMHVKNITATTVPILLCLEWRPESEDPDATRSWTGKVLVLARLVHSYEDDPTGASAHWQNYAQAPKPVDQTPFSAFLPQGESPLIIPGLSRFAPKKDKDVRLAELDTYYVCDEPSHHYHHCLTRDYSEEGYTEEDPEYDDQRDDAGLEARG